MSFDVVPVSPIIEAVLAKLTADLPTTYGVHDSEGPAEPSSHVPYVVLYSDAGSSEGEPLSPNRTLRATVSVRAVGSTAEQSRAGGDRVRASLHGAVMTVGDRRVYLFEEMATPTQRDDALSPDVLFEHLIIFGLRADP